MQALNGKTVNSVNITSSVSKKDFVLKVLSFSTSRNRMPLVNFFRKTNRQTVATTLLTTVTGKIIKNRKRYFVDFNKFKI